MNIIRTEITVEVHQIKLQMKEIKEKYNREQLKRIKFSITKQLIIENENAYSMKRLLIFRIKILVLKTIKQ